MYNVHYVDRGGILKNSFREKQNTMETDASQICAAILRSLSHDLRTPVSDIINASSFYLSNSKDLGSEKKNSLVQNIQKDSAHLLIMLENILIVSKLYDTPLPFTTTLEAVEEVISSAISCLKLKYPNARVLVEVPEALLLLPMDSSLFQQTLIILMRLLLTGCDTKYPIECTIMEKDSSVLFYFYSPNTLTDSFLLTDSVDIQICRLITEAHRGSFSSVIGNHCSSFTCTLPLGVHGHEY